MAEIVSVPGIVSLNEVQLSVVGVFFVVFLLTFIKWRVLANRTKSMQKMVDEMDTEKAEMYSKLKNFEEENKSLKEKSENMQTEYTEKMTVVEEKEESLDENSKKVKEKLKEIH